MLQALKRTKIPIHSMKKHSNAFLKKKIKGEMKMQKERNRKKWKTTH